MSKRDPNLVVHGGIYYRLSSKQIQVFRVCGPKRDNGRVTSETETRTTSRGRAPGPQPALGPGSAPRPAGFTSAAASLTWESGFRSLK